MSSWIIHLAWVGQLVGHHLEGKKPLRSQGSAVLLIGPIWLLGLYFKKPLVKCASLLRIGLWFRNNWLSSAKFRPLTGCRSASSIRLFAPGFSRKVGQAHCGSHTPHLRLRPH